LVRFAKLQYLRLSLRIKIMLLVNIVLVIVLVVTGSIIQNHIKKYKLIN
jgi:sensor histidine kinase regulating citrate/malate metabolism